MYRDKQVLNTFAKLAANEYLGANKTALNQTLKKIASDEKLTPHQIEYVAGEANKDVWARLFAMDKTASYDFPLADPKSVIGDLQIKPEQFVASESDLDYLAPPPSTKVASFDPMKAMGFVDNVEKQASVEGRKELKKILQSRMEKMAQALEEIERLLYVSQTKSENTEIEFVKQARTLVLETPFEDRGSAIEKIAEFVRGCDTGTLEDKRRLMTKFAHVCKKQGLVKESDLKAPEQYISQNMPARIVNGRHALFITLKTLFNSYDDTRGLRDRYEIVDSSLPVVKEKIREL